MLPSLKAPLAAAERAFTAGAPKIAAQIDFVSIIGDAINLLKGEREMLGFGTAPPHCALLGKFSHILVDEYQDIDAEQHELVALLAGKTIAEKDQKMTILAVGDDDQNIYRFRGANVGFSTSVCQVPEKPCTFFRSKTFLTPSSPNYPEAFCSEDIKKTLPTNSSETDAAVKTGKLLSSN